VSHNQKGEPVATVVGSDNKAAVRVLTTERAIGDNWLVSQGVAAGDRVIVIGLQSARDGTEVRAHEVSPEDLVNQPALPGAQPKP
jgi:membrane fusion protein (multidrug efflux system)